MVKASFGPNPITSDLTFRFRCCSDSNLKEIHKTILCTEPSIFDRLLVYNLLLFERMGLERLE